MALRLNLLILKGGSRSVVDRQLPKLNVAGSIPVSRSNQFNKLPSGTCRSVNSAQRDLPSSTDHVEDLKVRRGSTVQSERFFFTRRSI